MTENELTAHEKTKFERITQEDRQKTRRAWVSVLQSWFAETIAKGVSEGLKQRHTLVATMKSNSDTFVSRYDTSLGEKFEDMIWGSCSDQIRPPILIFLFDESEHVPLRGLISKKGNEIERLDWFP